MSKYLEIFRYFFTLGWVAFGGPAAHIALMERDLVERKKWMTRQEFLDYIGITNLIPGPNSTELTMHCGYHRGGLGGLIIGGVSFITPAVILTGILAYGYYRWQDLSTIQFLAEGLQIAVLVIIFQATRKLFKKAAKNNYLIMLAVIGGIVYWFYPQEIVLLIVTIGIAFCVAQYQKGVTLSLALPLFFYNTENTIGSLPLQSIFLQFLKIGSILYGSGYVLFAYLDTAFVTDLQILSRQDILDAVSIGQFTPGPVLSTSTFIGYKLGGWGGSILATLGIFIPSFVLVAITSPWVHKIRKSKVLGMILDAVNAISLSFMIVVAIKLLTETIHDVNTVALLVLAAAMTFILKWNPLLVLIVTAIVNVVVRSFL